MELSADMGRIGYWELYIDSDKAVFSDSMYKILGLDKEEVVPSYRLYSNLIVDEDLERVEQKMENIIETGIPDSDLHRIQRADTGELRYVKLYAKKIKTEMGNTILYGIGQDVTENEQKKEKVDTFKQAIESTNVGIVITDYKHSKNPIIYCNKAFKNVTGYMKDEVLGQNFSLLEGADRDEENNSIVQEAIEREESTDVTLKSHKKSGEPFWNRLQIAPITNQFGETTNFVGIIEDVTIKRERQDRLYNLIEEKNVLLSEVHDRVKNNLAIISGFLDLEKDQVQDPQAREAMNESQLRIQLMAQIHELVYQHEDLTGLQADDYAETLVRRIEQEYGKDNITTRMNIDSFRLNVNQAIPLGMMINELVTNAYKHAFPNQMGGEIRIDLKLDDETITVRVSDDGSGLPPEVDTKQPNSLGFTLVNKLASQLTADLQINSSEEGTEITLTFEAEEIKGSASNIKE